MSRTHIIIYTIITVALFTCSAYAAPEPAVELYHEIGRSSNYIGGHAAKVTAVDLIGEELVGNLYQYRLKVIFERSSLDQGQGKLVLFKAATWGAALKKLTPHLTKDERRTLGILFLSGISGLPFFPIQISYFYEIYIDRTQSVGKRRNRNRHIVEEVSFTLPPGLHTIELVSSGDLDSHTITNVFPIVKLLSILKSIISGSYNSATYKILKAAYAKSQKRSIARYNIKVLTKVPGTVNRLTGEAVHLVRQRSLKHELRNSEKCSDEQVGKIIKQSIAAGSKVAANTLLVLTQCSKVPNAPFVISEPIYSSVILRNGTASNLSLKWSGYAEFPLTLIWEPGPNQTHIVGHTYGTIQQVVTDRISPIVFPNVFGCFGFYPPNETFNYVLHLVDSRGVSSNRIDTTIVCVSTT